MTDTLAYMINLDVSFLHLYVFVCLIAQCVRFRGSLARKWDRIYSKCMCMYLLI